MLAARARGWWRFVVGAALQAGLAAAAVAADDARESRWADEILPALVVGEPVWLAAPGRPRVLALYTAAAGEAKGAVVLVHGLGVHPDFGVVGALRTALADAGFATLSVQMPVLAAAAARDDYPATFAAAGERIDAALAWLRVRGATRIGIVAHSLGAAEVDAYLARPAAKPIDAWVAIGLAGTFSRPPREPVLDVLAADELAPVRASAPGRVALLPHDACSRQLTVAGADHYFDARQRELAALVAPFLDRAFARGC